WSARGDFSRHRNAGLEGGFGSGRDLLRDAHPVRLLGAPMVAGQHVPHRITPARLTDKTHRGAAAGKPAMRVLILPETRIRRGYSDVAGQVNLVTEIPRVAVCHHHDRLRPMRLRIAE